MRGATRYGARCTGCWRWIGLAGWASIFGFSGFSGRTAVIPRVLAFPQGVAAAGVTVSCGELSRALQVFGVPSGADIQLERCSPWKPC